MHLVQAPFPTTSACLVAAALFAVGTGAVRSEDAVTNGCACKDTGMMDGFQATALLTDDADWEAKWNTPPESAVFYNTVGHVGLEETAILLVFFANPALQDGGASIECDLKIRKPNGESEEVSPFSCFSGKVEGDIGHIRMTGLRVEIEVEPSDPAGRWIFDIGVRDALRDVRVPLELALIVDSAGASE